DGDGRSGMARRVKRGGIDPQALTLIVRLAGLIRAGLHDRGSDMIAGARGLRGRSWRNLLAMIVFAGSIAAADAVLAQSADSAAAPQFAFSPDDVASPEGLPAIGKWMIDPDGTVAHWLGSSYQGKHIRETINVILVDHGAASPQDAKERLLAAAAAAGYPARTGHSAGYRGYIGGEYYPQLPEERDHAFSNWPFELDNNHGRIFGPAPVDGGYLFIGAFSRERIDFFRDPPHQYASFDQARDDFTQTLAAGSSYEIAGFVDLDNAILGDPQVTTGDHDGRAVLMRLER
ncbi:MAG TPA: hypothetical protein VHG92_03585, partial [Afifellaceae bacterium]|nr:hypothetical protein [Afifellaceae bacterium]